MERRIAVLTVVACSRPGARNFKKAVFSVHGERHEDNACQAPQPFPCPSHCLPLGPARHSALPAHVTPKTNALHPAITNTLHPCGKCVKTLLGQVFPQNDVGESLRTRISRASCGALPWPMLALPMRATIPPRRAEDERDGKDGVHFGAEGQRLIASALSDLIKNKAGGTPSDAPNSERGTPD